MSTSIPEITVTDLKAAIDAQQDCLLLDVRRPDEHAHCAIAQARLIPLAELPQRLAEIAAYKEKPVYIHCHHGGRSAQATQLLLQEGFTQVANVVGGIDAWSLAIDASVARY